MKNKKYLPVVEKIFPVSVIMLFWSIVSVYAFFSELCFANLILGELVLYVVYAIIGFFVFFSSFLFKYKKKRIIKYGNKFSGKIIHAEYKINYRIDNVYYLIIAFNENGEKKIYRSKGYRGDPNAILGDSNCSIYSYQGKYIETDLIAGKEQKTRKKIISTQRV